MSGSCLIHNVLAAARGKVLSPESNVRLPVRSLAVINIKLIADYECYPRWGMDESQIGNIDPDVLPVSEELMKLLYDWGDQYTQTLNRSDPASSGFKTKESEQAFDRQGLELWKRLRPEVATQYRVFYQSSNSRQEMPPDDLEN